MIPVSALSPVGEYLLLKNFLENEISNVLRIVRAEDAAIAERRTKRLKPQQLLAGTAFRLFGLDDMPVYNIDASFMQRQNDITQPVEAGQLLLNFKQTDDVAQNGMIYQNNVADYTSELTSVSEDADVLSFSKTLDDKEIVVVYNASETEAKEKFILLNGINNSGIKQLNCIYGFSSNAQVHLFHGILAGKLVSYIKIYLRPMQLAILKNY